MTCDSSQPPLAQVRWAQRTAIVDISGRITRQQGQQLRAAFSQALEDHPDRLLVNLTAATHSGDTLMVCLVELAVATRKKGIALRIFGLNPDMREFVEETRLDEVLAIFENEAEALSAR